jgi:hypothetical protein
MRFLLWKTAVDPTTGEELILSEIGIFHQSAYEAPIQSTMLQTVAHIPTSVGSACQARCIKYRWR